MSAAHAIAGAAIFTWLGMVLAISFIEAPLKFRAPGVTLQIGLGIGRLVFRALNGAEVLLAAVVAVVFLIEPAPGRAEVATAVAGAALLGQLLVVRPFLHARSNSVLAGAQPSQRSRAHFGYVALELVKVLALIIGGAALLTG